MLFSEFKISLNSTQDSEKDSFEIRLKLHHGSSSRCSKALRDKPAKSSQLGL